MSERFQRALEAAAPRNLAGKRENPLSQALCKLDIGWTLTRSPLAVAGRAEGLSVSTDLTGIMRVTGQAGTGAGNIVGSIGGIIVDVNADARVSSLKTQAAAHTDCPYATNLVAEEIKTIVDTYRANNAGLRYVVIVGNDGAIPFFRYPDETLIGQESGYDPPVAGGAISDASLSQDFVLSQDAYGAKTRISMRSMSSRRTRSRFQGMRSITIWRFPA